MITGIATGFERGAGAAVGGAVGRAVGAATGFGLGAGVGAATGLTVTAGVGAGALGEFGPVAGWPVGGSMSRLIRWDAMKRITTRPDRWQKQRSAMTSSVEETQHWLFDDNSGHAGSFSRNACARSNAADRANAAMSLTQVKLESIRTRLA